MQLCCTLFFPCVVVILGRVCVAQTVSRQPGPRLCGAKEGWTGKLPFTGGITSCPLHR